MYKMGLGGFGYRKLLSEKQFLQVQRRARQLMKYGTNLESIFVKEQTIMYKTRSSEYDNNSYVYTQRVYIEDASFENIINARNYKDIEKIMLNGGLKVHCNCLAKGTKVLTKDGYKAIEDVIPNVDYVLSSDEKWHIVAEVRESELKGNWKRVRLQYRDEPLIITTDHKIMWEDGEMRTLKEYKDGDRVQGVLCPLGVVRIEDAEPQVGYDVCLFDEPHNYVANGVIVSNCPAFHYWGYKYKAWKMGYGLEKELRRPVIRNPHGKGYVCKHLYFVLQTFPFYAKELAAKFGKYWENELKKR